MTGHSLALAVAHSLYLSFLVVDAIPRNLVARLGILRILTTAKALAVKQQLYLVAVGIDNQTGLGTFRTVPEL